MKNALRALRMAICSKGLRIVGLCVLLCWWFGIGSVGSVLGQGSAPSAPTETPAQSSAPSGPTEKPTPPSNTTSTEKPCTTPAKDASPYLLPQWWSFVVAMAFLAIVLALTVLVKNKDGINFFQSPDASVSVSKVQVWMWMMTIIFSYVYLFLWHGPPCVFPDSLWKLMGISALSTGAARYISAVTGDKPPTPAAQATMAKQNWLVSMLSDDGQPSMMRLQLFGWTLVSVFLFLMYLHKEQQLWDVPQTLVILMGISHAGYLGDKGATASKPS